MALRGKKPEAIEKRLKMFLYAPAGVGKTTAAIQFPRPYIIDTERGAENYTKTIAASGGVIYQTTDVHDMITEVKSLLTERHDFRTLVIDPITPVYNDLLDKCEARVGADFGRHYGAANKEMKRLVNLLMALDMNVIITSHAKPIYGAKLETVGQTFDAWKRLDYIFDLVLELSKRPDKKRVAKVVKTRLESFGDGEVFDWSYDACRQRYGAEVMERQAQAVQMATPAQVAELKSLLDIVRLPDGTAEKWMAKAGVDEWEDMSSDMLAKCIAFVKERVPRVAGAA